MSKFANSGAMWFIVVWQFAQMTADVSWKLIFAVVPPVMLSNAQGLVYAPAPMTCGVAENSAGNFEQTNVSWMKRTRRNAMFA